MSGGVLIRCAIQQTKSFSVIRGVSLRVCTNQQLNTTQNQQSRYAATKAEVEENIQKYKEGKFEKLPDPGHLEHFKKASTPFTEQAVKESVAEQPIGQPPNSPPPIGTHALPHPIWSEQELQDVHITHKPPEGFVDKSAYYCVQFMRKSFDFISGFSWGVRTEKKWINRICFLETVAGVPGMVAAMTRHLHSLRRMQRDYGWIHTLLANTCSLINSFVTFHYSRICFLETVAGVPGMVAAMTRHLHSLRRMQRDYGWIHTLLEEAENERMHLMTALQLKQPSWLFRSGVVVTQGAFVTMFSLTYLISPKFCHRFVGYLEEEAVKTYSKCLADIESGAIQHWKTQTAPNLAIRYWKMKEDATMRDVVLAIRADEAHHRLVNHTLASMKDTDYNPYKPGK